MLKNGFFRAVVLLLTGTGVVASGIPEAGAATSQWERTDYSAVRLISAVDGTGDLEQIQLGLHFKLKKNWKIYWRSAGDAGYPPAADWKGSQNLRNATIAWPAPERFSIIGLETLGYKGEVVLPIIVDLEDKGQGVSLNLRLDYLACAEICIPYEARLTLDIPAHDARPSAEAHLIDQFFQQVPGDGARHGLTIERAEISINGKLLRVVARARAPFVAPDLLVEGPDAVAFSRPVVALRDSGTVAEFEITLFGSEDVDGGLIGKELTFTLLDVPRMAEKTLILEPGGAMSPSATGPSLLMILGLALLGGLILNLMPCVLPVLSVKLLGVLGHGGGDPREIRMSFIASSAGILFAFLVLAGVLVGLKLAGASVGWGIQFQQPWFLIAMTLVVVLFACNLWGFFEFRLPGQISEIGGRASHVHGLGGHFLSGVFVTLLATPCSAPFLGTAIGFALARDAGVIFAVFAALGFGLAMPYLLIALRPSLAQRLPKPGRWMVVLRRVLGFALAATALWLLSVLLIVAGLNATLAVTVISALIIGVLFFKRGEAGRLARVAPGMVAVLAVLAFIAPSILPSAVLGVSSTRTEAVKGLWQPFDPTAIAGLVAEGKTVFVDVTAEWCITCQVNKIFAISNDQVFARLSAPGVVTMQADWTRPSDEISGYLASFGRYGIPFNVVYGPGAKNGVVLPELLTPGIVLQSLDKAASR